jgi:hypothetical protein
MYITQNRYRRIKSSIVLQSTWRMCITQNRYRQIKSSTMLFASSTIALRETTASKRIQTSWREWYGTRKIAALKIELFFLDIYERRKMAALTIERFFLMVKAAVDLEILRQEEQDRIERERAAQLALGTRPTEAVDVSAHADDISEISAPSVFHRYAKESPRHRYAPREEDLYLEEIFKEKYEAREKRRMEEEYLQRYELRSEKDPRRRRPRHGSSIESPPRRRTSSAPRGRRSPHRSREFASLQRRTSSSRDRHHVPPSGIPPDRVWSEEDSYRKETWNPSSRTYRSPKHYLETQSMRSEFSPHSSQATHGRSSKKTSRLPSSRHSLRGHGGYEYDEYDVKQHGRPQRRHVDYEHDMPTPRRHGSRERHRSSTRRMV